MNYLGISRYGIILSAAAIYMLIHTQIIAAEPPEINLLHATKNNLGALNWINQPNNITFSRGILTVQSEPKTDFFIDPETGKSSASAPVLYTEVLGDFVAVALVEPDLSNTWNAGSLMVILDDKNWIKFAFENSDATGKSIVTVVTKGVSDDANGVRLNNKNKAWLKLVRKGDIYSMHWSTDGKKYHMARLAKMPQTKIVKVGLEAQSPLDLPAKHIFHYFAISNKTVANIRSGI